MGTIDLAEGSNVRRRIKIVDTTGYSAAQLESAYNTNYGSKGWRLIGFVSISNKLYIVAEQEYA